MECVVIHTCLSRNGYLGWDIDNEEGWFSILTSSGLCVCASVSPFQKTRTSRKAYLETFKRAFPRVRRDIADTILRASQYEKPGRYSLVEGSSSKAAVVSPNHFCFCSLTASFAALNSASVTFGKRSSFTSKITVDLYFWHQAPAQSAHTASIRALHRRATGNNTQ